MEKFQTLFYRSLKRVIESLRELYKGINSSTIKYSNHTDIQ